MLKPTRRIGARRKRANHGVTGFIDFSLDQHADEDFVFRDEHAGPAYVLHGSYNAHDVLRGGTSIGFRNAGSRAS
jgi:hypothetical protein